MRFQIRALATFLALTCSIHGACAAPANLPSWMQLFRGQAVYFGIGYDRRAPACQTRGSAIEWSNGSESVRKTLCPTAAAGQKAILLNWSPYIERPGTRLLVAKVRFRTGATAWTWAAAPVVPPGAVIGIAGDDCTAEAARTHTSISGFESWRSVCKAIVVKQIVTGQYNNLIVRFARSGVTVRVYASAGFLLTNESPIGTPIVSVSTFLTLLEAMDLSRQTKP
jgi:hypothetical protein